MLFKSSIWHIVSMHALYFHSIDSRSCSLCLSLCSICTTQAIFVRGYVVLNSRETMILNEGLEMSNNSQHEWTIRIYSLWIQNTFGRIGHMLHCALRKRKLYACCLHYRAYTYTATERPSQHAILARHIADQLIFVYICWANRITFT